MRGYRGWFVFMGLLIGVCGCSSAPVNVNSTTLQATTTTATAHTVRLRDIRLDNVDPCSILTQTQRKSLSLTTATPYTNPEFKARACTFRGQYSGLVAGLTLVTSEGIELWTSDDAQTETAPVTVSGFPGLIVRTPGLANACNVDVDMAQGEFLDVTFRDGGGGRTVAQDDLCLGAQRVAEAGVASLVGRP